MIISPCRSRKKKNLQIGSGRMFRNDPNVVGDIFRKLLLKYCKHFLCVLFCIRRTDDYFSIFEKLFGSTDQKKIFAIERCAQGGECPLFYDSKHRGDADHPKDCSNLGLCKLISDWVSRNFHIIRNFSLRKKASQIKNVWLFMNSI